MARYPRRGSSPPFAPVVVKTVVRPWLAWAPCAIYDSGYSRTAAGVGERFSVAIEVRITGYSKTGTVRYRSLPLIRRAVTIPSASGEQVPQWRLHRSGVYASASHTSDCYRVHWQRSQQMGVAPSPRPRIQRRRRRTACPQRNENVPWRPREGSPTTVLVSYLPPRGGDRLSI
jgi:hypothetical protein